MSEVFRKHEIPHVTANVGSVAGFFFTAGPVTDLPSAKRADVDRYRRFFHAMLDRGIYLAPSQFEAAFVSMAHRDADLDRTFAAADDALTAMSSESGARV
jgi:glutamate-1-semialdehyde 2,1-aminomutase